MKYVQAFLSVTPSNAGLFQLKLYFCEVFLILKGATTSLKLWSHCRTKYHSSVVFWK